MHSQLCRYDHLNTSLFFFSIGAGRAGGAVRGGSGSEGRMGSEG